MDSPKPQVRRGSLIRFISSTDPHTRLQPGTLGMVTDIDDLGTIFVSWDDGSRLGLVPGIDEYELVEKR